MRSHWEVGSENSTDCPLDIFHSCPDSFLGYRDLDALAILKQVNRPGPRVFAEDFLRRSCIKLYLQRELRPIQIYISGGVITTFNGFEINNFCIQYATTFVFP